MSNALDCRKRKSHESRILWEEWCRNDKVDDVRDAGCRQIVVGPAAPMPVPAYDSIKTCAIPGSGRQNRDQTAPESCFRRFFWICAIAAGIATVSTFALWLSSWNCFLPACAHGIREPWVCQQGTDCLNRAGAIRLYQWDKFWNNNRFLLSSLNYPKSIYFFKHKIMKKPANSDGIMLKWFSVQ